VLRLGGMLNPMGDLLAHRRAVVPAQYRSGALEPFGQAGFALSLIPWKKKVSD
jgi:hypothetical protein